MALQKQTVSLNLANGIDQKDDDFVGDANTFDAISDFVWDKDRRLSKRFGTGANNQTVTTSHPNPLTIGASPIRSGTFAHDKQLLLQNKGALYSKDVQGDTWRFKGHHYPMNARTEVEHASSLQITEPAVYKFGQYLIDVYLGYDGFTGIYSARYRVYDTVTENQLVSDGVIESTIAVNPEKISSIKCLVFSNAVYIVWLNGTPASGFVYNMKIARINFPSGALGAISILKSDALNFGTVDCMKWVVCNKPGVGERAICNYQQRVGGTGKGALFAITNAGVIDASMTLYNSFVGYTGVTLYYSALFQRLYLSGMDNNTGVTNDYSVSIVNFTSSGFTLVSTTTVQSFPNPLNFPENFVSRAAFIDDSVTGNSVLHFYTSNEKVFYGNSAAFDPQDTIYTRSFNATASISVSQVYSRGLTIFGEPIYRADRATIYLPCEHTGKTQGTLFLLDYYKGKMENGSPYAYVQAKTAYRVHVGVDSRSTFVSPACVLDSGTVLFSSQIATRISVANNPNQTTTFTNPLDPGVVYQTGIGRTTYNFLPAYSASRAYLSGSTYLSGGYLGLYDGNEFCEHNFFLQPSSIEARAPISADRIVVNVIQNGGVGREISVIGFPPAAVITAPSPLGLITFWPTNFTSVQIGFRIGGNGTAPTGGTINILVDLFGTEPAYEVMYKTARAIQATPGISVGLYPLTNNTLEITNIGTGAVPDITATGFNDASPGPGVGTRSYAVVWSWTDSNGLQHRSAPSTTSGLATGDGTYVVAITAYCPMVTNRKVSSVRAEFYSTTVGGTTFYRLGLLQNLPSWQVNSGAVSYVTAQTDAQIISGEILYTAGGVLPNNTVEACTAISTFKNRLVVSGSNDNYVYYSKVAQNNLPVEMAEVLFIATENDGQKVTAHAQLDDKLMVLKTEGLSAYAGDGANDTGTNVSFSLPTSVASDVGSVNPSSLAVTPQGLWFRSKMGIQMITRGLEVVYPGAFVKDFNIYDVSRTEVLRDDKNVREVRFVLQGAPNTLVFNYQLNKWAVFSNYGGDDATLWQGKFTHVDSSGVVRTENQGSFIDVGSTPASFSPSFKTTWMKLKNVQDYQRIWRMILLGALKSPHTLNVKLYYDYDGTNFDSYTFLSSAITGTAYDDSVYQPEFHLKRQKCQSLQIEMEVVPTGGTEESVTLTDLSFLVGVKQGLNKVKKGKKL